MYSLLLVLACAKPPAPEPVAPAVTAPPAPPPLPAYATEVMSAMDSKADACGDFYRYACGGWIDNTPLPADKPAWGRSFSVIRDRNLDAQKQVLEAAAANPNGKDADWAKIGTFYGTCTNEAAVESAGVSALQPWFAEIDKLKDLKGVWAYAGKLQRAGAGPFVSVGIDGDYKNPQIQILQLSEGGLGLPDRDYYLGTDDGSKALLAAYEAHIAEILGLAGVPDAAAAAKQIVALETAMAQEQVPRADLRDPDKTYHKIDRAGLVKVTPKLDWAGFLTALGGKDIKDINVEVPDVFAKMQGTLAKTDIKALRAYLKWQLVHSVAGQSAGKIYDSHFAFFGQKILGQKQPEPRWKRCVTANDGALGEISGRYWVEKMFPGDSKQVASGMIQNVETAFQNGLPGLSWMDDATRGRAVEKMKKINNKIGYPDKWRDYSALTIGTDHLANVLAGRTFESDRQIAQIGKPYDPSEWFMTPPTVNAYYNATRNEMVFPAGILQAPFFDASFPAAMNYGGIGMVMGHELTHGFDDQGRKFDGDGKLEEWWAPEVAQRFDERAQCVSKQFDGYEVEGGLHVKGALTLGENIADLGGVRDAYRAFKAAGGGGESGIPGITADQLYFLSFAQGWCTVQSPEYQKMLVTSNPHSPSKYRVNGPLSNLPEFWEAFGCKEGTPMHPANACEVW
jgi:endothelin-converting enzyme/putative endopeptidase